MVLVFTRDTEVGDKLKSLLQKLDNATKANQQVRLAATVVFLDKDTPEVLGNTDATDDRRRELAAELKDKFAGMFTTANEFTKQNLVAVNASALKKRCGSEKKYKLDLNPQGDGHLYNKLLQIGAVHGRRRPGRRAGSTPS